MGEGKNKGKIVRGREMRRGEAVGRENETGREIEDITSEGRRERDGKILSPFPPFSHSACASLSLSVLYSFSLPHFLSLLLLASSITLSLFSLYSPSLLLSSSTFPFSLSEKKRKCASLYLSLPLPPVLVLHSFLFLPIFYPPSPFPAS